MRLRPVALRPLKARRSPNGLRRDGREGGGNSYGLMKVLAPVAVAAMSRDEEDEL